MRLAIFDLDHTLLSGDSDVLWCAFLIEKGLKPPGFREQSDQIASRYRAGTVIPTDYCAFYAATLAGFDTASLRPLREQFLREWVEPRIPDDARELLSKCRAVGDLLVLTTATNRAISELTAASQADAESLLGNQVPETSALASLARDAGAFAASSFGAGFGGSVWAVAEASEAAEVASRWRESYTARFPALAAAAVPVIMRPGAPALAWDFSS